MAGNIVKLEIVTELLVKFVRAAIQIERENFLQKKHNMKVLGIGNAIVDVVCKINEDFLTENNLSKSTMKLVDEKEFKKLIDKLKIEKTVSGGSVANSIVGLSQLGNQVGFIGKINDDNLGKKYAEGLSKENVSFHYNVKSGEIPTGTCLVLITPDSERTMCTFLGVAGKINENDINENIVKQSQITFLEGYLWDRGDPQKAFSKAISCAKKSAMSLSDLFCVDRHREFFFELVTNKLDITFANEQEIMALIKTKNFNDVIEFAKKIKKLIVITRGKNGSIAINNGQVENCKAENNLKIKDLTGAGDLFAAGFLHGYANKLTLKESLVHGTKLSSKIIQKIGARL
tara:strand:+ start:20 stop:1054 length:1035 start_codon:yes stop_codon:yes gene_type:complete